LFSGVVRGDVLAGVEENGKPNNVKRKCERPVLAKSKGESGTEFLCDGGYFFQVQKRGRAAAKGRKNNTEEEEILQARELMWGNEPIKKKQPNKSEQQLLGLVQSGVFYVRESLKARGTLHKQGTKKKEIAKTPGKKRGQIMKLETKKHRHSLTPLANSEKGARRGETTSRLAGWFREEKRRKGRRNNAVGILGENKEGT